MKRFSREKSERGGEKRLTEKSDEEEKMKLKKRKLRGLELSPDGDFFVPSLNESRDRRAETQVKRPGPLQPPADAGELEASRYSFLSGEFSS